MHKQMIRKLTRGMSWIDVATSDFSNKEVYNILMGVFNGEFGEGYALKKCFFKYSFDEEVAEIKEWEEDMEIAIPSTFYRILFDEPKWDNVHKILKGFNEMGIALSRLSALNRLDTNLRYELCKKETEDGYNPFKLYGIAKFERSFKGWRQAYLKELKDQIGRRTIENKRNEICNQYFTHTEYGQRFVFDPTTLREEENRIQLLDEVNGSASWYDKNQLQILSEKEYEEWYCNAVLPSILAK